MVSSTKKSQPPTPPRNKVKQTSTPGVITEKLTKINQNKLKFFLRQEDAFINAVTAYSSPGLRPWGLDPNINIPIQQQIRNLPPKIQKEILKNASKLYLDLPRFTKQPLNLRAEINVQSILTVDVVQSMKELLEDIYRKYPPGVIEPPGDRKLLEKLYIIITSEDVNSKTNF